MSIFVDLKRLFYSKDEVDSALEPKIEKIDVNPTTATSGLHIIAINEENWIIVDKIEGSCALLPYDGSYDSVISLVNFVGTITFPIKGNKPTSIQLKSNVVDNNLYYGVEGDVTHNLSTSFTSITSLNPYDNLLLESSSPVTMEITYVARFPLSTINTIADIIYPIGSIYMSVNTADPSYLFGGQWERIKDKFLLSAGDTYTGGSTGGSATVALTKAQMPRHNHTQAQHRHTEHGDWSTGSGSSSGYMYSSSRSVSTQYTGYATPTINHTGGTGTTNADANGSPHENMPPYLTVHMWKRIA